MIQCCTTSNLLGKCGRMIIYGKQKEQHTLRLRLISVEKPPCYYHQRIEIPRRIKVNILRENSQKKITRGPFCMHFKKKPLLPKDYKKEEITL
jgi:hypothetical protein